VSRTSKGRVIVVMVVVKEEGSGACRKEYEK
jgi:hypothetical protein